MVDKLYRRLPAQLYLNALTRAIESAPPKFGRRARAVDTPVHYLRRAGMRTSTIDSGRFATHAHGNVFALNYHTAHAQCSPHTCTKRSVLFIVEALQRWRRRRNGWRTATAACPTSRRVCTAAGPTPVGAAGGGRSGLSDGLRYSSRKFAQKRWPRRRRDLPVYVMAAGRTRCCLMAPLRLSLFLPSGLPWCAVLSLILPV